MKNQETEELKDALDKLGDAIHSQMSCRLDPAPTNDSSGYTKKYIEWLPDESDVDEDDSAHSFIPYIRFVYTSQVRPNELFIFDVLDDLVTLRKLLNANGFSPITVSSVTEATSGQDGKLTFSITASLK